MDETQLKEVDQRIWRIALILSGYFGAANIVAILGVWITVQSAAKDAAINDVHSHFEDLSHVVQTTVESVVNKVVELDSKRSQLESAVTSGQSEVNKLKEEIADNVDKLNNETAQNEMLEQELHNSISDETTRATALGTKLVDLENLGKSKLAELAAELKDMTLVNKIDETLHNVQQVNTSVDALKQAMNDKMSINKVYRMKSLIGLWYACVIDGKGYQGSRVAICDQPTVDYPENNAVWWTFQEKR